MSSTRYLVIQPSLDESVFKLWGTLPGVDGRIIEKALAAREGELPVLPHQGQGQRKADALTSISMDSLTGGSEEGGTGRAVTVAEVFIDGHQTAESFGEAGATVSTGPRVGPNTLAEILCTGKVRVIVTDRLQPHHLRERHHGGNHHPDNLVTLCWSRFFNSSHFPISKPG